MTTKYQLLDVSVNDESKVSWFNKLEFARFFAINIFGLILFTTLAVTVLITSDTLPMTKDSVTSGYNEFSGERHVFMAF